MAPTRRRIGVHSVHLEIQVNTIVIDHSGDFNMGSPIAYPETSQKHAPAGVPL